MKPKIHGRKTYALGTFTIAYILVQYLTGEPVSQELVMTLLTGMGITIRHGIANGKTQATA